MFNAKVKSLIIALGALISGCSSLTPDFSMNSQAMTGYSKPRFNVIDNYYAGKYYISEYYVGDYHNGYCSDGYCHKTRRPVAYY